MTRSNEEAIKRTIRRHQLREMVPLADSTIYEMEPRGKDQTNLSHVRFPSSPICRIRRGDATSGPFHCALWDCALWERGQATATCPREHLFRGPRRNKSG